MAEKELIAEKGKVVILDYEGRLETGELFDSSKHGDHSHPLTFEIGCGMVIPGFDMAVAGMKIGQEKKFTIEPQDAYGLHNPELKRPIPRSAINMDKEPQVGMILMMQTPQGQQVPLKIVEVTNNEVFIDLNHPLAGKKLIFDIKVLDIKNKEDFEKEIPECSCDNCQDSCECDDACECGDDCDCDNDCNCDCDAQEKPVKNNKSSPKNKESPKPKAKPKTKSNNSKKKK